MLLNRKLLFLVEDCREVRKYFAIYLLLDQHPELQLIFSPI